MVNIFCVPFADPATMEFAEVLPTVNRMYLVDSGLAFNSPYPPLLRQARGIDLLVSFDFSARENDYKENPLKVITELINT